MEAKFTVTLEDYVAYNLHMHRKAGPGRVRVAIYVLYLLGGAFLTVAYAADGQPGWAAFLAALTVGFTVFAPALSQWIIARAVRRYVGKFGDTGIVGPFTLILEDNTLTYVS